MIVEGLRKYMLNCPCLDLFKNVIKVNVNYLDSEVDTYSIEEVPCEPILKKYLDGSSLRQYLFVFTSREPYSSNEVQNIENSGFYEKFADWIEIQNDNEIFPNLSENMECTEIKVVSSGYAFEVSENTAQYQIQLRLKYLKKK
ncbi:chloramphenicol resistance protein [Clostridium botulinum]|nr:chloramphenicol resistance protein [Clostridium botulinum]NFM10077.1 chloramphenicol resistance protein [Clostridium botulinum]NFO73227.1 chloramphenicol resistance protein [Clostridium botulinum]